ncbi:transcriptional regulator domain-containing protein, partial [Xanthobacter versatilis]|uniref:transcriptional regulator domain-containing protein n=1 Tax=Xanthobacter autotrophicus (strain ATCC BAA-1158 / Py2) TaxID=78245 RepID=UPI00372C2753
MKPDTSRWREDASYDYFDTLSVEGLAWECLRRDETYQEHYQSLVKAGSDADPLPREVEQR